MLVLSQAKDWLRACDPTDANGPGGLLVRKRPPRPLSLSPSSAPLTPSFRLRRSRLCLYIDPPPSFFPPSHTLCPSPVPALPCLSWPVTRKQRHCWLPFPPNTKHHNHHSCLRLQSFQRPATTASHRLLPAHLFAPRHSVLEFWSSYIALSPLAVTHRAPPLGFPHERPLLFASPAPSLEPTGQPVDSVSSPSQIPSTIVPNSFR